MKEVDEVEEVAVESDDLSAVVVLVDGVVTSGGASMRVRMRRMVMRCGRGDGEEVLSGTTGLVDRLCTSNVRWS